MPAIGQAYAGPDTLGLRKEINPRSAVVATAKHGDSLEIIQRRRRFLKVRTASGLEGWTEEHFLLGAQEIARLKRFSESVKSMPSQGTASVYDSISVHSEPARMSPSFMTIKEGEKFEVITRQVSPRKALPRPSLVPTKAAAPKSGDKRKERKPDRLPPPPAPAPPKPPTDWIQMSGTPTASPAPKPPAEPEPTDEWALIRTASGESGWILSRRVVMSIPDEVAQYAEGRRITSYFRLGEVRDGDLVKPTWLWTTVEASLQPYDFDSFRVFVWSLRHHRYETALIQRRVTGYFPVLAKAGSFSVCLEKNDGTRYRRSYAFNGYMVKSSGDTTCEPNKLDQAPESTQSVLAALPPEPPAQPSASVVDRWKDRIRTLSRRWFAR